MNHAIVNLLFALILFAGSHSLMADVRVKAALFRWKPYLARYYRLLFNCISVVSLALVYLIIPPSTPVYSIPFPWALINFSLIIWALWNAYLALQTLGTSTFLGIRQLTSNPDNLDLDEHVKSELITKGWFSRVRHPLYFFSIIALVSNPRMTDVWLTITAFCVLYFFIGRIPEEKRLEEMFGNEYRSYKRNTPALFPSFRKKR